jgi:hypothetical protein
VLEVEGWGWGRGGEKPVSQAALLPSTKNHKYKGVAKLAVWIYQHLCVLMRKLSRVSVLLTKIRKESARCRNDRA